MSPTSVPTPASDPVGDVEGGSSGRIPWALAMAVVAVGLEAAVFVGLGVAEVVALDSQRLAMGLSTAAFFAAYGVLLGFCARALGRREGWARSIVVMAQLIHLGTAWSNRDASPTWAAAAAVVALVALVGIFHPASLKVLDR